MSQGQELTDGRGGRVGREAESYNCKEACPSTIYSLLSDLGLERVCQNTPKHTQLYRCHLRLSSESIAALPSFGPIEGHKCMVCPDFQPKRVPEEPVCIYLFRQNPVFTSLHLKSPVHVVPPLKSALSQVQYAFGIEKTCGCITDGFVMKRPKRPSF